ncbi:MAG TPA: NAD(P)/FAD-dependent oxidoreductase [Pirellulaceae bacterium]|nr:NAD(P)/FAD-dependent oxidoreductase [Pirellulaceae bacterium]HMO91574.1 NAD(P)/FAD-dependent oxidoreductase [Pirellulaceae bacterium]HMP68271.1 NAD(P)/FAD-dependent oxidoreductase [Pirellulaceae bacterium]
MSKNLNNEWDVIVIGAGAAGLFAAGTAAARNRRTLLLEKNTKLGVKILMSGGTRCNLTHNTDWQGIADAFGKRQGRFLKFALANFPPNRVVSFFHNLGVFTKIEETGKIFPLSNRAIDVRDALVRYASQAGAEIIYPAAVNHVLKTANGFSVRCGDQEFLAASVVIACGGQSYPGCGTSGDGYAWVRQLGHSIIEPRPALVPLRILETWTHHLSGITIPDTGVSVVSTSGKKLVGDRTDFRGSLLFTHRGFSGPAPMNISRVFTDPQNSYDKVLVCDWLPSQPVNALEQDLQTARTSQGGQSLLTWLSNKVPRRLAEALCMNCDCDATLRMAELSRKCQNQLLHQLKACQLNVDGTLGFAKAEVTAGGVELSEVDAKTMESKIAPKLFLVGEILDVDGPIGGYNFQAAFSTGYLAGTVA